VVVDALSRKTKHELNTIISTQPNILRDLENMGTEFVLPGYVDRLLSALEVQPSTIKETEASQKDDAELEKLRFIVAHEKSPGFVIYEDEILRFQNRLCVPNKEELTGKILEDAHNTQYSLHPGEIYRNLRQFFWWDNMKSEIVDKCLTCQKVNTEC